MDMLRAQWVGKNTIGPITELDSLVEEREAVEAKILEDTIDWLEEKII